MESAKGTHAADRKMGRKGVSGGSEANAYGDIFKLRGERGQWVTAKTDKDRAWAGEIGKSADAMGDHGKGRSGSGERRERIREPVNKRAIYPSAEKFESKMEIGGVGPADSG